MIMMFKNPNEHWYYNKRYDMKEPENMKGCFYCLVISILLFLVLLVMTGCKSIQYVPVPEYHSDTIYFTKVQFDSIWQHDSVYIHEYTKGDTVYYEHIKWHTKIKEKLVHDTTYISKTDSVAVPYPVEKQLSKWQKLKMEFGGYSIVICLLVVIIIFIGFVLKMKKRR